MRRTDVSDQESLRTIHGAKYLCEVPPALGGVVALVERRGKLIAETESGTPFIVPTGRINDGEVS